MIVGSEQEKEVERVEVNGFLYLQRLLQHADKYISVYGSNFDDFTASIGDFFLVYRILGTVK